MFKVKMKWAAATVEAADTLSIFFHNLTNRITFIDRDCESLNWVDPLQLIFNVPQADLINL